MARRPRGWFGAIVLTVGVVSAAFAQVDPAGSSATATAAVLIAVAPDYPDVAVAARVQADVVVEIDVSADGVPNAVRSIKTHPLFEEASFVAARQWRFASVTKDAFRCRVAFGFHLLPEGTPQSAAATRFVLPYKVEVVRIPLPVTVNYSH